MHIPRHAVHGLFKAHADALTHVEAQPRKERRGAADAEEVLDAGHHIAEETRDLVPQPGARVADALPESLDQAGAHLGNLADGACEGTDDPRYDLGHRLDDLHDDGREVLNQSDKELDACEDDPVDVPDDGIHQAADDLRDGRDHGGNDLRQGLDQGNQQLDARVDDERNGIDDRVNDVIDNLGDRLHDRFDDGGKGCHQGA